MIHQAIFNAIHGNALIYNTCWEDPRCDRDLLNLQPDSKVVMLTSAGCNALDYLLDGPVSIDCVDMNPRQNALLELKKALFLAGSHPDLYRFFGEGKSSNARDFFADALTEHLDDFARKFWKRNLNYFDGKGVRQSFYWRGTSGAVAFMVKKSLEINPATRKIIHQLFNCKDLEQQRILYYKLEPRLLNQIMKRVLNSHLVQSMLGVPKSQQELAKEKFRDGLTGYFRTCFRKVFTEIPVGDNYFWKLYFFGQYTPECCPNYLKADHFNTIRQRVDRIATHTTTLSSFLVQNPGQYTHFVLLDHQDWLAAHNRPALHEEWELILRNSAPGATILFRSAAENPDFLPAFVTESVRFDRIKANISHQNDRVGTYASVHLGYA
jgi:S-adenosylmethionine-diacylglycerol 3-amino-3-carboxypropyl transferase